MRTLSDQLRDAIRKSGMTQIEIGDAAHVSDGIISRFMRGERSINLETADRLAKYLRLELRDVRRSRR